MGVHHFILELLPKGHFECIGAAIPTTLSHEEIDQGEDDTTGWWATLQPSDDAVARLRRLCPFDRSWGETEEYVTNDTWGSDLRIWRQQGQIWSVVFRFSPGTDSLALLHEFLAIARDEQCLVLDRRTHTLFEPDVAVVLEHLRNSRAMRFLRDPRSIIIEGAGETIQ